MNRIYVDKDIVAGNFYWYDASCYTGSIEEAREELECWIDQGWATTVAEGKFTMEVTAEDMQAAIREHLLHE